MIPYFEQPSLQLGPITIHAFGVIVAIAVWAGLALGQRRFRELHLDPRLGESLAGYVLVCGFLGAHLFAVLFYSPRAMIANPLILFRVWDPISSFGGILGGMVGAWLCLRVKAKEVGPAARWAYIDVAAYVFPASLAIGRLGCAVAHDHPGTVTSFPLAVSLESEAAQTYVASVYAGAGRLAEFPSGPALAQMGFHDLGWYESLYLMLIVVPLTLVLGRRARAPGTFLMSFIALYMPVRFGLDFLRVGDARYAGLTPAQWVALAMVGALPLLWRMRERRKSGLTSLAVVLIPLGVATACWSLR